LTTPDVLEAQAALEGDAKDSLLQRWNTLGHAHLRCWVNNLGAPVTWRVGSSSTARTNLVTKLRAASGGPADDLAPLPSLEVHGAVGYARQVEVARDALLHAVRELGVRPHEIRVVTTDVQRFAPLMSALWSPRHATGGRPYLQFETADPRLPRSSDRLRAFRQFLRTVDSHFTMLDVVALLNEPALQLGLGLHRNDVERLSSLAANYGVSMGLTAESRAALDVFEANDDAGTWERFADRGLLSSVFERSALGETHPIQPLGVPDDVAVFAEVARLVETLRDAVALLGAPQPLSAWHAAASTWSEL
jgi:exodeoxyribonuclease V gamma subunit